MVATAVLVGRRGVLALAGLFGFTLLSGCKIVAIGDTEGQGGGFDAITYAEKLWASQALPHFQSGAKPVTQVIEAIAADIDAAGATYGYRPATEGSPWTFIVSGSGKATAKNTESRAGTLTVAIDGAAPLEVALQVGPVVRGNAVRDSLPFVSFKDFTNQLEFADVGKAFTALSVAATADAAKAAKVGDTVTFTGVMSLNTSSDKILVTPVALQVGP